MALLLAHDKILRYLTDWSGRGGAYLSTQKIADALHLTPQTTKRRLQDLMSEGRVEAIRCGSGSKAPWAWRLKEKP